MEVHYHALALPFAELPNEKQPDASQWSAETMSLHRIICFLRSCDSMVHVYSAQETSGYTNGDSLYPPSEGINWDPKHVMWTSQRDRFKHLLKDKIAELQARELKEKLKIRHVFITTNSIHGCWAVEEGFADIVELSLHVATTRRIENMSDKQMALPGSRVIFSSYAHRAIANSQRYGVYGISTNDRRDVVIPPLLFRNEVGYAVPFPLHTTYENEGAPYILFYDSKLSINGLEIAIAAVRQARLTGGVDVRLVVCGEGDLVARLAELSIPGPMIAQLAEFVFEIPRKGIAEKNRLLTNCAALIAPILGHTASPGVVYEAMLSGIPVICSDVGSHGEYAREYMHTLQTDDVTDYAAVIVDMITDLKLTRVGYRENAKKVAEILWNAMPNTVLEYGKFFDAYKIQSNVTKDCRLSIYRALSE